MVAQQLVVRLQSRYKTLHAARMVLAARRRDHISPCTAARSSFVARDVERITFRFAVYSPLRCFNGSAPDYLSRTLQRLSCLHTSATSHLTNKSHKGYISPICGEAPTEAMYMKICVVSDVLDVITCAKFQNEIFRRYNFTGGRIFHFSY